MAQLPVWAWRGCLMPAVFIRTAPVDDCDGGIEQSKIDLERSAAMVPVIQQDRPHHVHPSGAFEIEGCFILRPATIALTDRSARARYSASPVAAVRPPH